ncbi:MAG: 2-phosphosulfolactate phosphatase [Elainellaceae cyanobacterium]
MNFDQADFEVRCEWGEKGILQLATISDVVIIIDVLSFSTCIDVANSRGAIVFPYHWKDESTKAFAQSVDAEVAEKRGDNRYSLSPASLLAIALGTRLVLPSPNGSSLSLAAAGTATLTGCLRNCRVVALAAMNYGQRIAVIPAGEKWHDGSLRPSFEDFIGAGAVISYLRGKLSPEAQLASEAYQGLRQSLEQLIRQCGSGRELIERGFEQDVDLASEMNVSDCVPTLVNGAYANHAR